MGGIITINQVRDSVLEILITIIMPLIRLQDSALETLPLQTIMQVVVGSVLVIQTILIIPQVQQITTRLEDLVLVKQTPEPATMRCLRATVLVLVVAIQQSQPPQGSVLENDEEPKK